MLNVLKTEMVMDNSHRLVLSDVPFAAGEKLLIFITTEADLQTLAEHVELTPSNYVREILISRLLGDGMLPQRSTMFKAFPTPAADDWAEGKEIPMREVSEEEFRASTCELKEVRTKWVDADN